MDTHRSTHLLISNCEPALRLLVGLRKGLELLDGFGLQDSNQKFRIRLRVLVAGLQL